MVARIQRRISGLILSDFSHQQAALLPDRLLRLSRWLFQLRRAQQAKLPFFLCRPTKSTSRVRLAAAPPTRQFAASARTAHHYSPKTESNSLAARSPPAPRTLSPPSPRNWVPTPAEPPPVEITDDAATGPPPGIDSTSNASSQYGPDQRSPFQGEIAAVWGGPLYPSAFVARTRNQPASPESMTPALAAANQTP